MKKKLLKKSEVLREGYVQVLRKAQSIINEMLEEGDVLDNNGAGDVAENDAARLLKEAERPTVEEIETWREYILDWLDDARESIAEEGYDESEYEWLAVLFHDQYDGDGFLTSEEYDEVMRVLVDMARNNEITH